MRWVCRGGIPEARAASGRWRERSQACSSSRTCGRGAAASTSAWLSPVRDRQKSERRGCTVGLHTLWNVPTSCAPGPSPPNRVWAICGKPASECSAEHAAALWHIRGGILAYSRWHIGIFEVAHWLIRGGILAYSRWHIGKFEVRSGVLCCVERDRYSLQLFLLTAVAVAKLTTFLSKWLELRMA